MTTSKVIKAYNFDSSIDLTKNKYAHTIIKDVPCYSLNAMIKNTIKKAPKRQTKNLFVANRGDIVIDKNKTAKYVKCIVIKNMYQFNAVDAE